MGKGDFKNLEASTKDGNTVLAKLLHAALDEAPLPTNVRRVCGVITRTSFGNWDYGEQRRATSCELSAFGLSDTLQLRLDDLSYALGKLVEWRLVRTAWKPGVDPRRIYRFQIERKVDRWIVPGFDAERARKTFLNERQAHVAKHRRFKPRRSQTITESDPSPLIQAHRELMRGVNPLALTPDVLSFQRAASDMISCVGRPATFQDAARVWIARGNVIAAQLGGRGWLPPIGPGDLDRRGAARLEAWLLERLQVDRVFKDRPEYKLEKKVRALLEIELKDPLGHAKVMIGRALILDWIWLQELHGFPTAKVTYAAADPKKSLCEVWLGVTPEQLLESEKGSKATFLRFLRVISRGAVLEKHAHTHLGKGKRGQQAPVLGTAANPGLGFPAGADLRSRHKEDRRAPLVLKLRVTKLAPILEDSVQMCTRHGLELLGSVSPVSGGDVLSTEPVTECTEKRADFQSPVQLLKFLDREITRSQTFHNFHILRTLTSVVGSYLGLEPYKNYHFQHRDGLVLEHSRNFTTQKQAVLPPGMIGELQTTRTPASQLVQISGSKNHWTTGCFVRGHGTLEKRARYTRNLVYRAPQPAEPISGPAKEMYYRTGKTCFTSTHETVKTSEHRDDEGEAQKFEAMVWTPNAADLDVHWVLSGLEYLLGWRGWRPVSGSPFPVRRSRDSIPAESPIPVVPDGREPNAAPPATGSPAPALRLLPPVGEHPGSLDPEDDLPPPRPVDPAVMAAGARSLNALRQEVGLVGLEAAVGFASFEDPTPPDGPGNGQRMASYRNLDPNELLVALDKAVESGHTLEKQCHECHQWHGPLDVCYDLAKLHAEVGLEFQPGQYHEPTIEELRAIPEEDFWVQKLTAIEAPGPRHEDRGMGYREGEDTLDLFQRCMARFSEPQSEWAEQFFDLDFIARWIALYDRVPFFSTDPTTGRRYRLFVAGLRMHMESLMALVAKVGDLQEVKRLYVELYFTPERRLKNQEKTLDTFARLLTTVLVQSFPSMSEPAFEAPKLSDPTRTMSLFEIQNMKDGPKTLSELLVLTNGELMAVLAEGSLRYIKDGDSSKLDLSGIPEMAHGDSAVVKFLLEVAHGKWIALMPCVIRKRLFDAWLANKLRYEHFKTVVKFYRALRRAGHVVYDALPEQYKLDKLPFLTNEAALRAAMASLEAGPVKNG